MHKMITAVLLVALTLVGVSACTVPRATTVTSEDRQHAKDAAAAAALFEERMKICTSTKPGWDEARCKATESQVAKANEALQYVPDVCSKYPVDEDTCADAIVAKRVKNGEVSPYDTVISPWRTAALIGGIVLALIVLGGCALVLLRRSPQPANRAARPTKPRRSTPQVQPPRQTVRRPSPPPAAPSAPAPVPGRPMSPHVPQPQQTPPLPHVIMGEVVGYTPPPAAPAREPLRIPQSVKRGAAVTLAAVAVSVILGFVTPLGIIPWGVVIAGTLLVLLAVRAVLPNGFLAPRRVIIAMATFAATVLATFLVASCVVSIGTWIAGPPQPDWLHWLEWKGDVRLTWPAALILAITTTTLVMRKMVKSDRSRR